MSNAPAKKYLLDTNVLIEAYNKCYNPNFITTFWDRLVQLSKSGTVGSIDKVKDEINKKNTFLTNWSQKEFVR